MNDETENVVLRALRRIKTSIDGLREDIREIKTRLGILEQEYASMSNRVDRIEFRLDRIEKRLDLVEA
jgi:predicted  nucleic acid-binding Zn-ribbon protein